MKPDGTVAVAPVRTDRTVDGDTALLSGVAPGQEVARRAVSLDRGGEGGRRDGRCRSAVRERRGTWVTLSEIFIRRRVGTSLLAGGLILLGSVAYFMLPVAPLPQIDFPTIQVETTLPGASAGYDGVRGGDTAGELALDRLWHCPDDVDELVRTHQHLAASST